MNRTTACSVLRLSASLRHRGSNVAVSSVVRAFRTSTARLGQRAIVYSENGDPSSVLSAVSFPDLPPPAPKTANVRFLLSPINPADINVIEGVYPARPSPSTDLSSDTCAVFVAGKEGVAEVLSVGDGVTNLKERDWVVITKPQMGTWTSSRNVRVEDVLKVDSSGLNPAQAATLTVCVFRWPWPNETDDCLSLRLILPPLITCFMTLFS